MDTSYERGGGVGRVLGVMLGRGVGVAGDGVGVPVGVALGVAVGVAVAVGVGVAVAVDVGVAEGPPCAQYLPPVFKEPVALYPPQTII